MFKRFNKMSRSSSAALTLLFCGICHLHAQGVAKSPMRSITARQLVYDMKVGWNLGNTLDAPDGETTWGNPTTTQAMIDAVKAMGFKTVRIPVTWDKHMGGAPEYTIDKAWLDRVETVVNYVLRDSMYAILNTHHDEWVKLTAPDTATPMVRFTKLWTQIATRFKDYGDYLIFETLNEPRQTENEWNGGTPVARAILNKYHQNAVSAIRATGGNNTGRFLLICGHSAAPVSEAVKGIVIPDNNDPKCVISLHTYYPQDFSFAGNVSTWGTATDKSNVTKELDREKTDVASKGGGTAIIGEWGAVDKNNLSARVAHAEYYAQEARTRGMLPVWWDNGGTDFGILDRKANPPAWKFPTIAQALVRGAGNATPPIAVDFAEQPSSGRAKAALFTVKADRITYTLPASLPIAVRLISLRGETVATLLQTVQTAGTHSVILPVKHYPAGSYFIAMCAGSSEEIRNVTFLR
jgi:endoglucanase